MPRCLQAQLCPHIEPRRSRFIPLRCCVSGFPFSTAWLLRRMSSHIFTHGSIRSVDMTGRAAPVTVPLLWTDLPSASKSSLTSRSCVVVFWTNWNHRYALACTHFPDGLFRADYHVQCREVMLLWIVPSEAASDVAVNSTANSPDAWFRVEALSLTTKIVIAQTPRSTLGLLYPKDVMIIPIWFATLLLFPVLHSWWQGRCYVHWASEQILSQLAKPVDSCLRRECRDVPGACLQFLPVKVSLNVRHGNLAAKTGKT